MYYLALLTGDINRISWVGGIATGGKKPHQDLILDN
jgi:hypothetical protein